MAFSSAVSVFDVVVLQSKATLPRSRRAQVCWRRPKSRSLCRWYAVVSDLEQPQDVRRDDVRPSEETDEKPKNPNTTEETSSDVKQAYSLGDTLKDSPALNSTLMNAMRDYFGDDGREVQDYFKRPVNEKGEPMFRVIVVGAGARELETVKRLDDSGVVTGLYYCPDTTQESELEFADYAASTTVSSDNPAEIVRFAKWCVADAVFVGPDRGHCIDKENEAALAEAGITLFPYDVSAAIADGTLSVKECLSSIIDQEDAQESEAFVE